MGTKETVLTVASETELPSVVLRARAAVEDARAYARKPATANLADFRNGFVRPIFGPVLADEVARRFPKLAPAVRAEIVESILDAAPVIAGSYSRYQDSKRNDLLGEIASPTVYRIGSKRPASKRPAKKSGPVASVASEASETETETETGS